MSTTEPMSEVTIANMAIDLLSDQYINDLSQDGTVPEFIALNFGPVRDELLQMFPWNFAAARALLAQSSTPAFGWKYGCELPADCIIPREIRTNGKFNYDPVPFEYEGSEILTDYTPAVPLIYTKRETNPTKFSPLFSRTLANRLAWYGAQVITGKAGYVARVQQMMLDSFENARLVESLAAGTPQEQWRPDILTVRGLTDDTAVILARND